MKAISGHQGPPTTAQDTVVLSVLVPLHKRQGAIGPLHAHLSAALIQLNIGYELVLIDDGSTDGTRQELAQLAARDPAVVAVMLERTVGQTAALNAGLAQARGQATIIIEGDLNSAPDLLPRLLYAWRSGAQVVNTRRSATPKSSPLKRAGAVWRCRLLNLLCDTDTSPDTGSFQLLSRRAVDGLSLVVNHKRFMRPLFDWMGLTVVVIDYAHTPPPFRTCMRDLSSALGAWLEPFRHPTYQLHQVIRHKE